MSVDVWVLGDNRIGNTSQAIALAEALELCYDVKNIKYNIFGKLPNFFLEISPIHIKQEIVTDLESLQMPKILISAGRRTATLATYLKRKSAGKLKIIQIMRPTSNCDFFDLIVLPQHDHFSYISPKIIRTIGALSNLDNKTAVGQEILHRHYPEMKKFIAVIIGGDTKSYKFDLANATLLAKILVQISDNHQLPLLISFSRRTPQASKQVFRDIFSTPNIIYDPEEGKPNPYFGMLKEANYIISTADSISMCSDAASSGKPFYIFCPDNFKLNKHRFFIQQLFDLGIARRLEESTNFLQSYSYQKLREVEKVAEYVRTELLS